MRRRPDPKKWTPSPERPQPTTVTLDVPADRGRVPSRKYGRTAADPLPKPRCGMRCPDEPQLEQGEGHEQDADTGDIAPALYQRGLRGLARREVCRHLRHLLPRESPTGTVESCLLTSKFCNRSENAREDTWRA